MYTPEEKQNIEQVMTVFQDYWQNAANAYTQPLCEILWLDRMQCYVLLLNYSMTDTISEKDLFAIPIQSAEELFTELVDELAHTVYTQYHLAELSDSEITEALLGKAQEEIMDNLNPYLQALPQYKELAIQTIIAHGESYIDGNKTLAEVGREVNMKS